MPRDVIMPALGMAQKTGSIVQWLKQPGDAVKAGDVLMEVETDKAVMEVAAEADGFLVDVRAAPGEDIPVGEVIARIAEAPALPAVPTKRAAVERPPQLAKRPAPPAPVRAVPPVKAGRIFASPRARRLAAEQGLDLARLAEAGEPQPYLARHLATLRSQAPAAHQREPVTAEAAAPVLRLTATLPGDGLAEFCAWRQTETGAPAGEAAVIAGMAAAALRPHAAAAPLVVAVQSLGAARRFVDPDRAGLGAAEPADGCEPPSLLLRDLRGSFVTEVSFAGEPSPALTLARRGAELWVTLECTPAQLPPAAAVEVISAFAGCLAEPLRHLL